MVKSRHLRYSTIAQIAHQKIVPTQIKNALLGCTLLSLTGLLASCGGSSSGGIYNQAFNLSGQWSGQIGDGNLSRVVNATLNQNGTAISGIIIVTGHSCISSRTFSGTATQNTANNAGDNPLTGDQENSNTGAADLVITITETVDETEITHNINFTLIGSSNSLTGQYAGAWIPEKDADGDDLEIPGDENATCRTGIEGSIQLSRI